MGVNMIEISFKKFQNRRQNLPKSNQNRSKIAFKNMIAFRNALLGPVHFVLGVFFSICSRPGASDRVPKIFKNRSRSGLKVRFCFSSVLKPIYKDFGVRMASLLLRKLIKKIVGRDRMLKMQEVSKMQPLRRFGAFFP